MADNQDQIDYWNGEAAANWVAAQARLDAMLSDITEAVLERAEVLEGERVLDVGCGCGTTSLLLAEAGADVWGIDISEPMLAEARRRAAGTKGVRFTRADAASHSFSPEHDLVFSRFGVMFFDDPERALANLRSALKPGARLCFVCWQTPAENPWAALAGRAVQPFLETPATPADPRAPGPFAFGEADYLRGVLEGAGFTHVHLDDFRTNLHLGDDLDDALEFQRQMGPLARAMAELEGEAREQAMAAVREVLAPHVTPRGLSLGGACWIVSANSR